MRRSDALLLTFFLAAACRSEPDELAVATSALSCTAAGICYADDPLPTIACPETRQIVVLPGAGPFNCDDKGAWDGSALFPGATVTELKRYCVYEWTGGPTPNFSKLPPSRKPDCNIVAAQGSQWSQDNAAAYEVAYFAQIEQHALPTFPQIIPPQVPSRMMVVDSAVNTTFPEPGTGQLDHGRVMGEIGRKLGCPDDGNSACRVEVASVLALALVRDPQTQELVVDTAMGGFVGRLSDTARAIVSAVDYAESQGNGPIVVNLSLGWDPYWGGEITGSWTSLDEPMRAVYSAVTYAACRGALVVASSGNTAGGAGESLGAAFPAGWETEPGPDSNRCLPLGGLVGSQLGVYKPLLYAVGAVDGRDRPLILERGGSRPRLVAPGDHVAMTRVAPPHSTPLSGTSVAAAGVSAIAATVWAYQSGWSRYQIMDLVYNYAVALPGVGVDFCNGGPCPNETRRASLCRAVRRVCQLRNDCAFVPACGPASPGEDQSASNLAFVASPLTQLDFGGPVTGQELGFPCDVTLYSHSPSGTENPCPSSQFRTAYSVPHMVPQPIIIACPSCGLYAGLLSSTLYIEIASDAPDGLSDAKLRTVGFDDKESVFDLRDIPEGPIQGQTFKITDIPIGAEQLAKASVEFVVNGSYSQADPVSIIYQEP